MVDVTTEEDIAKELEELKEAEAAKAKALAAGGSDGAANGEEDEIVSKAPAAKKRGPPVRKVGSTNLI